jgi:uncharacterized protein
LHAHFGLTLVVNHACNLRCTYCYTGDKFGRPMSLEIGRKAIGRAVSSLSPSGTLDLAFFGGEPLIEAELILGLVDDARDQTARRGNHLALNMTTNGTIESSAAWEVMTLPEMQLSISHDGLPAIHNRHRIAVDGQSSSRRVEHTIGRLIEAEKQFRVVTVVHPNGVESLSAGMQYLYSLGVRQFDLSLDLWTNWTRADGARLSDAIGRAADFWGMRLPECSVNWFDEKAARASGISVPEIARCGFAHVEIAVTPAGNLFPCERLVGADDPDNAMRLPGNVFDGDDFLNGSPVARTSPAECVPCVLRPICNTTICRCSNYVRTGDVNRPDGLLCLLDQACYRETVRVLQSRALTCARGA